MITSIVNAAAAAATTALAPKSTAAAQQASSLPLQKTITEPVRRKCKRDWLEDAMQYEEHAALA